MAEWNRTTPWRQGHILSEEATAALHLKSGEQQERAVVVVISHDCDLATVPAKEPQVEAILGRLIEKPDGNYVHAKNSRTLHVPFICADQEQWVELTATEKLAISKTNLAGFAPRTDLRLDPSGRSTLQLWLAARYRRAAFPDAFENRLKGNGLHEKLAGIVKPMGEHIRAICFDVDDGKEEIRTNPEDTYALTIYVLYSTESDPEKAQTAAEDVREKIEFAFQQALFEPTQQWRHIELRECIVISDEALTYRQWTFLKQWRMEHLSLREEPPGPMLQS